MHNEWLGNAWSDWLLAAGVALAVVVVLWALRLLVRTRLVRLAERTETKVDDVLMQTLAGTHAFFMVIAGGYAGSHFLELAQGPERWLGHGVGVAVFVQVGLWVNSLISGWQRNYVEQRMAADAEAGTTLRALAMLARIAAWSILLLVALASFGVDITAVVAGLGIGGVAVALAVQNILSDIFASLSIVLDRPFVVGDFIIVGDLLGTVEKIGIKTTRVRSLSGEQLIFSNNDLLTSRIRNYKRMEERRALFTIGVVYQTPHAKLKQIPQWLKAAVEGVDGTRFDRAHFKQYGAYSLDFEVVYFVLDPDYNIYMDTQQSINLAIHGRFEAEGVEFAYPTQTVLVEHEAS